MILSLNILSISKYRNELMGMATILILICHSCAYIEYPRLFNYFVSYGNIGVDVFLFLSGFGLSFSLSKSSCLFQWYRHRYNRILTPYFLIIIPLTFIRYALELMNTTDLFYIIKYILTIQFWIDHNGVWYIAMLLPLYLITPLLFKYLQTNTSIKVVILILFCYSFSLLEVSNNVLTNIQFVIIRLPSFLLGLWIYRYMLDHKTIDGKFVFLSGIMAVLALLITKHFVYSYTFAILPCVYLMNSIIEHSKFRNLYSFFGKISLESYLFNISIPSILLFFLPMLNHAIVYLIAVVLGVFLSYVSNYSVKSLLLRL